MIFDCDLQFHNYIQNNSFEKSWKDARKLVLDENNKLFYENKFSEWKKLSNCGNSKDIWKHINWKGTIDQSKDTLTEKPTAKELSDHFLTKSSRNHENIDMSFLPNCPYVHVLDKEISMQEVDISAKMMCEGKSTSDGWCPKMIHSIDDIDWQ